MVLSSGPTVNLELRAFTSERRVATPTTRRTMASKRQMGVPRSRGSRSMRWWSVPEAVLAGLVLLAMMGVAGCESSPSDNVAPSVAAAPTSTNVDDTPA